MAAIAKGRDRDAGREMFFVEGRDPFRLPPRDPALYFVQRLRDEAHRFAIGTHRARRKKDFTKNPLDEIDGIGPSRKRALLAAFGTAKALSRATLGDLEKVPGINAGTAKRGVRFFPRAGRVNGGRLSAGRSPRGLSVSAEPPPARPHAARDDREEGQDRCGIDRGPDAGDQRDARDRAADEASGGPGRRCTTMAMTTTAAAISAASANGRPQPGADPRHREARHHDSAQ